MEVDEAVREDELVPHGSKRVLPIEGQAGLAVHGAIIPPRRPLEVAGTPGRAPRPENRVRTGDGPPPEPLNAPRLGKRAKPIGAKVEGGEVRRRQGEGRK